VQTLLVDSEAVSAAPGHCTVWDCTGAIGQSYRTITASRTYLLQQMDKCAEKASHRSDESFVVSGLVTD